jgi:hypothetical protein
MRHYLATIRSDTWERLWDLQKVYDLDIVRSTARKLGDGLFAIQAILSEKQIEQLRADAYEVEIIADAELIAEERKREI